MNTQKYLIDDFNRVIAEIIQCRQTLDGYVVGKNDPTNSAHTYSAEVQVEYESKIGVLTREADLILTMLDDLAENNPTTFVGRLKKVLRDLVE